MGKVFGGCGRGHVNLQEMQENTPSVSCGVVWQHHYEVRLGLGHGGSRLGNCGGEPEFLV